MTHEQPKQSARPKDQTRDETLEQAKSDALSPDQKHQNYLDDLERLHKESVVDSLGHTPRAGQRVLARLRLMANLADKSGDAYSNIVQGEGTPSLSFPMPGTVPLDVESVVATIDNSAGGATTPTLVVRDSSGEVIATKRMDGVIPAGDTGTATFSLRNSGSAAGIRYHFDNEGDWLDVTATGADFFGFGIDLIADAGIRMAAHGGEIALEFGDYNAVQNGGTGDYHVQCGSYLLNSDDLDLVGVGGEFQITSTGTFLTGDATVSLAAGKTLTVTDRVGNPIFRVNEDGSLQGKTGKALTFNL